MNVPGLWRDGRLSWPLVLSTVFLCGWLLVADFAWRLWVVPFWAFAAVGVAGAGAGIGAIVWLARRAAVRRPGA